MEKDQKILNILLELEKNMVKNYATAITETSTEKLESDITDLFNDTKKIQRDIFNFMSEKGWYKIEQADCNKISQDKEKCENQLNNLEN